MSLFPTNLETMGFSVSSATFPGNGDRAKSNKTAALASMCKDMQPGQTIRLTHQDKKALGEMQNTMKHAATMLKWGADGTGLKAYRTTIQPHDTGFALFIQRIA